MKTSSFRTSPQKEEYLKDIWGSTSAGATRSVDAYIALRKRILNGLKNRFTQNELMLLIDHQNGTIFSPSLFSTTETMQHSVSDAIILDGLDSKWEIDKQVLFEKISRLSDPEAYFIREEIDRFWNHMGGENIKEFVNSFSFP
jgi:hypothetical protein